MSTLAIWSRDARSRDFSVPFRFNLEIFTWTANTKHQLRHGTSCTTNTQLCIIPEWSLSITRNIVSRLSLLRYSASVNSGSSWWLNKNTLSKCWFCWFHRSKIKSKRLQQYVVKQHRLHDTVPTYVYTSNTTNVVYKMETNILRWRITRGLSKHIDIDSFIIY